MTEFRVSEGDAFLARLVRKRKRLQLTQGEVAEAMGVSQSRVSAIELQDLGTMEIGTLSRYVEALGGSLRINVVPRETKEGS